MTLRASFGPGTLPRACVDIIPPDRNVAAS